MGLTDLWCRYDALGARPAGIGGQFQSRFRVSKKSPISTWPLKSSITSNWSPKPAAAKTKSAPKSYTAHAMIERMTPEVTLGAIVLVTSHHTDIIAYQRHAGLPEPLSW